MLQCLFLCYNSCIQSITGLYYMAGVNNAFVSELHNKYFTRQI